jgi:hypothetical protein
MAKTNIWWLSRDAEVKHYLAISRNSELNNREIMFATKTIEILRGVQILCVMAFLHCESRFGLLVECVYILMHVLLGIHSHFSPLHR